ncbi:hypothetical protein HZU40_16635 [Mycolicibacterium fluoranthenivorans]|jgi:hypothetical protein|uniref:Membrane alanine rich protein n=1 Tax=Mycolicibacterium fluoranthenivorans TaxID=258505 RepID=A0A1G4W2U2_9MYCO|nr:MULTISPECIES: hypothetical protein [Mycobacteriaceae]MCV7251280.1 hypothetical protein [Mycobacterium hackensackense]QNJ95698.1 hypothetical protein HZU40_16635 [Mycolicibacterium fluoranthenivorans]SCX15767.1 hypothetical protein SAMN02799620_02147 [Mycolicibacterium fluoranthenivorans]
MMGSSQSGRRETISGLMQRGIDTAAEFSDVLAQKLAAAADPRAKLLRKRRWARRLAWFFAATTGFWILVTGVLASWSTPVWALIVTGAIAAAAAFPTTLLFLRYRWLRREPLPETAAPRRLPPRGSVARAPMAALASSERGLLSLLGVLSRSRLLPDGELREISMVAAQTASTMSATAAEVVAMERAAAVSPQSRTHLAPTIDAFTVQLHAGARQYGDMVTAAAQLVSAVNAPTTAARYRDELTGATDRLQGWAQAYHELGQLRGA